MYRQVVEMEGFDLIKVSLGPYPARNSPLDYFVILVQIPIDDKNPGTPKGHLGFWRRWRDLNPRTPCDA